MEKFWKLVFVSVRLSHQVAIANFPVVPLELQQSSRPRLRTMWPLQQSPADRRSTPRWCPRSSTAPYKGRSPRGTQEGRPRQRTCWRDARRSPLFRSTCAPARHPLETNWSRLVTWTRTPVTAVTEVMVTTSWAEIHLQWQMWPIKWHMVWGGDQWADSFIHSFILLRMAALCHSQTVLVKKL